MEEKLKEEMIQIAKKAKESFYQIAFLSTETKNQVLNRVAELIELKKEKIKEENLKDLSLAKEKGYPPAFLDRLTLSEKVLNGMIKSLLEIASLPDPVGEIVKMWRRPKGFLVGKMRVPLGVILMIYESRPNVTIEAGALCFKSGNAVILKGGKEAFYSNLILGEIFSQALKEFGLPQEAVQVVPTTERKAVEYLLELDEYIHLVIPRGGEGLIRFVTEKAKMPVLKHYKGVCHVYVDKFADLEKAIKICVNAKCQRPGVCNAMETLLVHKDMAKEFLPKIAEEYKKRGVEIRGCEETVKLIPWAKKATEEDWGKEFLDLILSVKVVNSFDEALKHIQIYGSNHTEAIVTENYQRAMRFLKEVDASAVMVNVSTRFNDGGEFGLGAEIGISTTKLHAYGPMGLEELTTTKFVVLGNGEIRE